MNDFVYVVAQTSVSNPAGGSLAPVVINLVPSIGMIVVAVGAFLVWRLRSGSKLRWFWAGAAIWAVSVISKYVWVALFNKPILEGLYVAVPNSVYFVLGGIYIGLLTGVFEVGMMLAAALIWKQMTRDAARGIAVGVGAGAFEALLLGIMTVAAVFAALALGGQAREQMIATTNQSAQVTHLWWLVAPVDRIIIILCHIASRAIVLFGVARGRWFLPFIAGFFILTAVDAVVGYVYLTGLGESVSRWWVNFALAPFALFSIFLVRWCARHWPNAGSTPDATELTSG